MTAPLRAPAGFFRTWAIWLTCPFLLLQATGQDVDYLKQIKPLLQSRCYVCHGALKQKAHLRLDTVQSMLEGGKSGPALRRGDPTHSLLLERVTQTNPEERMPPEHEGEALSPELVSSLKRWIAAGAPGPANETPEANPQDHWAFRPRIRPPVPKAPPSSWIRNPIDAFLTQQHTRLGLIPQPDAPDRVLLRRLYLDLVGLPPSPKEVRAFEDDHRPGWYERTVERLLEDPRHGERWARHWMDIWRYSDWWGLGDQLRNSQKHLWHWRDWIVESLNADMPYDEMVRLMLAADELKPGDPGKLRATGFLARNYFLFNRDRWMEETVEHVSKGFLGLSLNCSKCHDHKYDPLTQKDFYRMRAFFEPYQVRLDMIAGETDLTRDGLPRAFDAKLDTPTYLFVRGQETQPDRSAVIAPGVPALFSFKELGIQPIHLPAEAWQPERRAGILESHEAAARRNLRSAEDAAAAAKSKLTALDVAQLAQAQEDLKLTEWALAVARAEWRSVDHRCAAMRAAWAVTDAGGRTNNPALAQIESETAQSAIRAERDVVSAKARFTLASAEVRLSRTAAAQHDAVEKEVQAAREAFEKAEKHRTAAIASTDTYTRLPGAKWTTTRFLHPDKDDPEVDFPSTSSGRRTALGAWITDPRNPLTARVAVNHIWARHLGAPLVAPVFEFGRKGQPPNHPELLDWLASELIDSGWSMKHLHRLIVTSSTYRRSSSLAGGEASQAKDPENRNWWRRNPLRLEAEVVRDSILALSGTLDLTQGGPPVPPANQSDSRRRSLYFFHSNNERNLFLTTFDEAGVVECYQREQSIVPQQALALSNSGLVQDAAAMIAERLSRDAPSRPPRDSKDVEFIRDAFLTVLGMQANDAQIAASQKALLAWRQSAGNPGASVPSDAANAHLIWALLNHNDFVTLR